MKLIALISILFLFGCASDPAVKTKPLTQDSVQKEDSALVLKLMSGLKGVENELLQRGIIDSTKNALIDTLQKQVILYQFNTIKLKVIQLKLSDLMFENKEMFANLDKLKSENAELKDSNIIISKKLTTQIAVSKSAFKKLQDIKKLSIANVSVKGMGVSTSLFRKDKVVEVSHASILKSVTVAFNIIGNEQTELRDYSATVCMYSVDNIHKRCNDFIINYTGSEKVIETVFDNKEKFMAGSHKVEVVIDNKLVAIDSLILK